MTSHEGARQQVPPLARIRVLDLTRVRAGPTAVKQLSDWGADAIAVEAPAAIDDAEPIGGPREAPDFQNLHRNKRSITLNLKSPAGREVFYRLVKTADVVVENYRPSVKHRLAIDYDTLRKINPRIVYASISGFGQDGPYVDRPGVDQVAQGLGGIMSITGEPGRGPMRVGVPMADLCAGLFGAMSILVALVARGESGEGRWVQTSLLQAQIAMLDLRAVHWLNSGELARQAGNNHPTSIPTGVYEASDGPINIGGSGGAMFARFSRAIGMPELGERPEFSSEALRYRNRDELNAIIGGEIARRTRAEWTELLNAAGVPAGPIHTVEEVFVDPQVRHLDLHGSVPRPDGSAVHLLKPGFQMTGWTDVLRSAAPARGEHTDLVLTELGYTSAEIAKFRSEGVL
ncbi:MAG: CoA transferase [Rhizobiales bacterium]|nr:CoA transferase [Hyphomicrobiales bacterium]